MVRFLFLIDKNLHKYINYFYSLFSKQKNILFFLAVQQYEQFMMMNTK